MNIVIAEDDIAGRKVLHHFLTSLKEYTIVGEAANGEELIRYLIMEKPDIAIVDIKMPFVSGLDAIKSCKALLPSLQVIFLTGYDEFAVEALEWNAADYIMKPVMLPRLKQALDRAKRLHIDSSVKEKESGDNKNKNLIIKHYNNLMIIPLKDIIYIEKAARKTVIHTKSHYYHSSETLIELKDKLSGDFIHSHRSFIINTNQIAALHSVNQTCYATFEGHKGKAKISKSNIDEIQRVLLKHN